MARIVRSVIATLVAGAAIGCGQIKEAAREVNQAAQDAKRLRDCAAEHSGTSNLGFQFSRNQTVTVNLINASSDTLPEAQRERVAHEVAKCFELSPNMFQVRVVQVTFTTRVVPGPVKVTRTDHRYQFSKAQIVDSAAKAAQQPR